MISPHTVTLHHYKKLGITPNKTSLDPVCINHCFCDDVYSKAMVEHFKLFLRSYQRFLGDGNIDVGLDYEQINEALTENNWLLFKSIIRCF